MSHPPAPTEVVRASALASWRAEGRAIVMITAYDHPTAELVEAAGVDVVLVGDSAGNVVLGYPSTVAVTVDELLVLVRAVRRGLRRALLVADLPFGSYEVCDAQAVTTAIRFVKEGGADAVKLERGGTSIERAAAIVAAGIPVMGHVGLTPQTAAASGGYRARGRSASEAARITQEAIELQSAGCFAVVAEAVPAALGARLRAKVCIPVIGIGAGADVDGQVLVLHDLLGLTSDPPPRFVRRYADLRTTIVAAVGSYADDVRNHRFPGPEHTYGINADELSAYDRIVDGDANPLTGPVGASSKD